MYLKTLSFFILFSLIGNPKQIYAENQVYNLNLNIKETERQNSEKYTILQNPATEFVLLNGITYIVWFFYGIYNLAHPIVEEPTGETSQTIFRDKECLWLNSEWDRKNEKLIAKSENCYNKKDNQNLRKILIRNSIYPTFLISAEVSLTGLFFINFDKIGFDYFKFIFGGPMITNAVLAIPAYLYLIVFPKKEFFIQREGIFILFFLSSTTISTFAGYYLYKHFNLDSVFTQNIPEETDKKKTGDKFTLGFHLLPLSNGVDLGLTLRW